MSHVPLMTVRLALRDVLPGRHITTYPGMRSVLSDGVFLHLVTPYNGAIRVRQDIVEAIDLTEEQGEWWP